MPYAPQVAATKNTDITTFIFFVPIVVVPNAWIPQNPFGQLYLEVIRSKAGILRPKDAVVPVRPNPKS
jgi:hypothetical protein